MQKKASEEWVGKIRKVQLNTQYFICSHVPGWGPAGGRLWAEGSGSPGLKIELARVEKRVSYEAGRQGVVEINLNHSDVIVRFRVKEKRNTKLWFFFFLLTLWMWVPSAKESTVRRLCVDHYPTHMYSEGTLKSQKESRSMTRK